MDAVVQLLSQLYNLLSNFMENYKAQSDSSPANQQTTPQHPAIQQATTALPALQQITPHPPVNRNCKGEIQGESSILELHLQTKKP